MISAIQEIIQDYLTNKGYVLSSAHSYNGAISRTVIRSQGDLYLIGILDQFQDHAILMDYSDLQGNAPRTTTINYNDPNLLARSVELLANPYIEKVPRAF